MDEKFPNLMKPVSKKLNEPQAQMLGDRLEVEGEGEGEDKGDVLASGPGGMAGVPFSEGEACRGAGRVGSVSALGTQMEVSRAAGMMGLVFRRQWNGDRSPGGHGLGGPCRRELRARGRPQDTPSVNQETEPEGPHGELRRDMQRGRRETQGARYPGGLALMRDWSKVAMLSLRGEVWCGWLGPRAGLSQDIVQKVVDVLGRVGTPGVWKRVASIKYSRKSED